MEKKWDSPRCLGRQNNYAFFFLKHYQDPFERPAPQEEPMPDARVDRYAWFSYWDEDNSGTLDKDEVIRAFVKTFGRAQTPLVLAELRSLIEAMWPEFDPDGSGSI